MEYKVNSDTFQIEPSDAAMEQYTVIAALKKMNYDEVYEIVGELPAKIKGHFYDALRDQMADYED